MRKRRQFKAGRCYHLVSRIAHRAEKGLCTKEEREAFCAKSQTALRTYLDKQVESGVLTPAERKAIGR